MVIIPYYPIRDEALKQIVRLKIAKIQRRIQETHKIALTHDEALVDEVARRCTEVESGRPKCGQYFDEHDAAGSLEANSGTPGRTAEARADPC